MHFEQPDISSDDPTLWLLPEHTGVLSAQGYLVKERKGRGRTAGH